MKLDGVDLWHYGRNQQQHLGQDHMKIEGTSALRDMRATRPSRGTTAYSTSEDIPTLFNNVNLDLDLLVVSLK